MYETKPKKKNNNDQAGPKAVLPRLEVILPERQYTTVTNSDGQQQKMEQPYTGLRASGLEYEHFCKHIMRRGYGMGRFKEKALKQELKDFMKPGFEAFLLLAFENIIQAFLDEKAEKDRKKQHESSGMEDDEDNDNDEEGNGEETKKVTMTFQNFKYTGNARCATRNCGWSGSAMERYNELHYLVVRDREINSSFDKQLADTLAIEYKKRGANGGVSKAKFVAPINDVSKNTNWNDL